MKHQIILHCLKPQVHGTIILEYSQDILPKKLSLQILLPCVNEREKLFLQNLDDTWTLVKRKKWNTVSVRDCIEGNMCTQVKKILSGKDWNRHGNGITLKWEEKNWKTWSKSRQIPRQIKSVGRKFWLKRLISRSWLPVMSFEKIVLAVSRDLGGALLPGKFYTLIRQIS